MMRFLSFSAQLCAYVSWTTWGRINLLSFFPLEAFCAVFEGLHPRTPGSWKGRLEWKPFKIPVENCPSPSIDARQEGGVDVDASE